MNVAPFDPSYLCADELVTLSNGMEIVRRFCSCSDGVPCVIARLRQTVQGFGG